MDGTGTVDRVPLTTAHVLTRLGLGPAWGQAVGEELRAAGAGAGLDRWDAVAVSAWLNRMVAASDLLTIHEYRVVAMRSEAFSRADIRRRAETAVEPAVLRRCALTLALRYTADLAPMRPGRAGHRLVRDGLPQGRGVPRVVRRSVEQAWLTGACRADIVASTGVTGPVLTQLVAALPPRVGSGEVTRRFGWSPDNVFQRLKRGTFPSPDGFEGELRWWWPATIDAWEASRNLVACPQCGARVERLGTHRQAHR